MERNKEVKRLSKPYYAEYVNHCLRFYFMYDPKKGFKNAVDKENYRAVEKATSHLRVTEKDMLRFVFIQPGDNLSEHVKRANIEYKIKGNQIWILMNHITRKIAKERGLI